MEHDFSPSEELNYLTLKQGPWQASVHLTSVSESRDSVMGKGGKKIGINIQNIKNDEIVKQCP